MMDLIRNWLIGVTAAAMVVAVAKSLMPEGTIKKIGKFAGGLLLLIVILRPVISLDEAEVSAILTNYRVNSDGYSRALEEENLNLMKVIIEEETAAYIQDKANELGFDCTAEVICGIGENDLLYPEKVRIYGDLTQAEIGQLSGLIETDLAIAAEAQQFERTNRDGA